MEFTAGVALQAYLTSGDTDAEDLIGWARRTGRQVTVRLIKGAYWDYEVVQAERMNWPTPVWRRKVDTDACFERMAERLVAAYPRHAGQGGIHLAVGSHNLRSIARVLALVEACDQPPSAIELQMLFGMAGVLQGAVLQQRLRLRQYVPIGPLIPGMAYLVRRLLENVSNQSWLRAGFFDDAGDDELLASPHPSVAVTSPAWSAATAAARHELTPSVPELDGGLPFVNEPLRDFADRGTRERFAQAITELPVPNVPNDSTPEQAVEAVRRAAAAFTGWRNRSPLHRAQILVRAAQLLADRRDQMSRVIIGEAGKPWREADADVCEAIDFCRFYARWACQSLVPQTLGRFVGEHNTLWYEPRGVAVVISPWNFPLAICTGMTVAALVTGNTVIVKPAEQTPGIARLLCETLWQAGVPAEVLQLLPGLGETVGAALVRDPRVAVIAFTGSKEVGLEILEASTQRTAGQRFVKKVVCEMGGKNAIIVDESADLDQAVLGVRQSAFGYAGQKCSACSRVILVGGVERPFLDRFLPATQSLIIGDPRDPGTDVGPVIDAQAAAKIRAAIEAGKVEARLELACPVPEGLEGRVGKPYVGPHVFSGVQSHHRLAQEEIFGPVLAVMHAGSFAEALDIADSTDYRLTGGVFSRRPSHLELARREFRVGNLYLNRGITGALVGRQPFGGFGLSGTGTKAGGAEYLLHFVQPRSCCEDTMRHGFAPGLE